jgi:hypothetical protein
VPGPRGGTGRTRLADKSDREDDLRADEDLHATSEDIAADAARLKAIEEEKAHLDADDPRTVPLSEEGEQIARRLVPKTVAEHEIADEADD